MGDQRIRNFSKSSEILKKNILTFSKTFSYFKKSSQDKNSLNTLTVFKKVVIERILGYAK